VRLGTTAAARYGDLIARMWVCGSRRGSGMTLLCPLVWLIGFEPTPGSTRLGVVDMSDDLAQVAHVDQRTARLAIRTRPGFVT